MKKVVGWILVVCGILSLPGFLSKLPTAHDGYELVGMFIGQGLIYFLAYLCLRNKKSNSDAIDNNVPTTEKESVVEHAISEPPILENANVDDEVNDLLEKSLVNECKAEGIQYDTKTKVESFKVYDIADPVVNNEQQSITVADNHNEPKSYTEEPSNQNPDFRQITYSNTSWKEIFDLIYSYQRDELQAKSNPSNFMVPYDHDKIAKANDVLRLTQNSMKLEDLRAIRSAASEIGISVAPDQLFAYLCVICSPTNFTGKENEFMIANDLYGRILQAKNNVDELENILIEARSIGFGIPLEIIIGNAFPEKMSLKTKILLLVFAVWEGANIFMLASKGVLYNAKDYFFPFHTSNLAKYDYTEFLIYGVLVPVLVAGVIFAYRVITNNKSK